MIEKLHLQYDWRNEEVIEKKINEIIDELNSIRDLLAKDEPQCSEEGIHPIHT